MLNTDMCLMYQSNTLHADCMREEQKGKLRNRKVCKKFERKGEFLYAQNSTCCAWMQQNHLKKHGMILNGEQGYCGLDDE